MSEEIDFESKSIRHYLHLATPQAELFLGSPATPVMAVVELAIVASKMLLLVKMVVLVVTGMEMVGEVTMLAGSG